jgi:predicted permease
MPHRDFVSGDLEEEYADTVCPERGKLRADLWFLGQAVRSMVSFLRPGGGLYRSFIPSPPLLREVRHAVRGLARRPGFSALAVVTLAVGIGTATSVFSVADAVLFRLVPGVDDPDALATVSFLREDGGGAPVSLPNLRDLGEMSPGVADIAGYSRALLQVAADGLPARTAWSQIVTGAYFELLGVKVSRGRLFSRAEADDPAGPALAVVSDAFWRRVFQADPAAVGRTLRINGLPFNVVGVMEPEFRGVERLDSLEIWVPASQHVALRHGLGIPGWELEGRGAAHFANTVIRRAPGTSPAEAQEQLRASMVQLVEAYPDHNEVYREARPTVEAGIGLRVQDRSRLDPTLRVLAALVGVILLVTCANVANLLVLRGVRRREETALRRALGAARGHLVIQNLAEALLLSLPAAVLGLIIAVGVNEVLWSTGLFPYGVAEHTVIDLRVFLFAAGLGVLTATTFGLLPALLHERGDQRATLGGGAGRASSRTARALQGGLSMVQLALSLALVGGVMLLARTSANLSSIETGISPENVIAMEVDPGPQGYRRAEVDRFRSALVERVEGLTGVESVAASGFPPFGHLAMRLEVRHPDDATRMLSSTADWVTSGFFKTLRVPVLAGRDFSSEETTVLNEASRAVVIGRTLAVDLFGAPEEAVGRSLEAAVFGQPMAVHVVGVVEDVIDSNLRREPRPKMYVSMPGSPQSFTTLLVRSRRPMEAVAADVRTVLDGVDANVPLGSVTALEQRVANATVRERTFARLSALLASIAMLLAGVGLYSVVAYAAAQRRREFGIRIAVGASRLGITLLVLRHALVFGLGGVILGLAVSVAGSRLLAGVVFGVAPTDPVSLGGAAAVLLLVTVLASLWPARTATRVDPAVTLKVE